jgi:hypothetical protein
MTTPAQPKFYLAARYSRNAEMRACRDDLAALGYEVTSRWIDLHAGRVPVSFGIAELKSDPDGCRPYAIADVDDLEAADAVLSFTSADGGGKGGRHIEFGLALGLGKRLVIIGPCENVFHTLPQVEQYEDWAAFLPSLALCEVTP